MQASRVSSEVVRHNLTHGEAVVKEYIQVKGLSAAYVDKKGKERVLEEAVRFIQVLLLRDLRPPWLEYAFPQALPGGGVLSRLTRAQLLFWPACLVATVFGDEVEHSFALSARKLKLVFAGIVARPLYNCTELLPTGDVCMKVVSMSPFLQMSVGRREYKCTGCMANAQKAGVAPGSASAGLRCLYAYATVEGVDGKATPLRRGGQRRLLVHAPPDTWGWARPRPDRPSDTPAASPQRDHPARGWYNYTEEESDRIWHASEHFQGRAPLVEFLGGR